MGDSEKYNNKPDELIDVSDDETEFSDEALTEIEQEEEEVTPLRERPETTPLQKRVPSPLIHTKGPKRGTFIGTLRERFAAFFIDSLFLFYLYWVYATVYGRVFLGSWSSQIPYSGWHGLAFHSSFLLLCFLYYFVFEGIFLTTIGKFVCWMSVRKKNGEPASLIATFIRNLLRPLDYILIIPVVFIMEHTKFTQRIGDMIAGTTVVKKFGTAGQPYNVSPEELASASGRTFAAAIDIFLFFFFIVGYVLIWSPKRILISQVLLLLTPLAIITYFVLIEMVAETSPGKWLMGYIICHEDGRRLTMSGSILRTIWRLFDTNPVGLLCMFISSHRQRPGDLAAGTVVIKQRRTIKGAIGLVLAIALAVATLYPGMLNRASVFSRKFKFNFLPRLSFIDQMGLTAPEFENIEVRNFRFAANEPNNFRVPPTFSAGETVYLVFELVGYAKQERKVWLQEDLSITYPDGSVGLRQNNIVDYHQVVKGSGPIEFTNNITLPQNANPGEYQVSIIIRDKFGRSEADETNRFYVRRPILPGPSEKEE